MMTDDGIPDIYLERLEYERDQLKAENERLRAWNKEIGVTANALQAALSWIGDQDPQIVEQASKKFNLSD